MRQSITTLYVTCLLLVTYQQPVAAATLKTHQPVSASVTQETARGRYLAIVSPYIGEKNLKPYAVHYGAAITQRISIFAQYGVFQSIKSTDGQFKQSAYEFAIGRYFGKPTARMDLFAGMTRGQLTATTIATDTSEQLNYDKYFTQINLGHSSRILNFTTAIKLGYSDALKYKSTNLIGSTVLNQSNKPGLTFDLAPKLAIFLSRRLSMEIGAGITENVNQTTLNSRSQWWTIGIAYRE